MSRIVASGGGERVSLTVGGEMIVEVVVVDGERGRPSEVGEGEEEEGAGETEKETEVYTYIHVHSRTHFIVCLYQSLHLPICRSRR